ncbi:fido (protein-threonine AMPylation protein) [Rhodopseudomonas rhenobacensis]|uniref:Fido (Protein-threonine AMPylation protein) n=1 Tax=Rhodopseudomonas rhenobacensis TaxID=87461 RepID=A0A7W7Z1R9_9BRAD|nr:Fic family protein [Rhodopseudomonas rhenobacensis]MBB5046435.1 fido (protein-threonine AMPylation protein) [Rhodopseudomonas rhenobacensis]
MEILDGWLSSKTESRLRISHLLILNRVVLEGINKFAGTFRSTPIKIGGSAHVPPDPTQVPIFVEDFCEYINSNRDRSAIHLAAYALWRLNWIHPFADGNGRTARIVSYMLLCQGLGYRIPGSRTIPEQISENKGPYYRALESADRAFVGGAIDVSEMEALLEEKLATQLLQIHNAAKSYTNDEPRKKAAPSSPDKLPRRSAIVSDVEYLRPDGPYAPVYVIQLPESALTSKPTASPQKTWVERNSALITAAATVMSALIAAFVTWLATKK